MLGVYLCRSCSGFCFVNRGQAVSTSPQVPGYNRNWKKLKREWQKGHIILGHSNKDPCTLQSLHILVPKPYPSSWVDAASREGSGNRLWAPLLLLCSMILLENLNFHRYLLLIYYGRMVPSRHPREDQKSPPLTPELSPPFLFDSSCNHLGQGKKKIPNTLIIIGPN